MMKYLSQILKRLNIDKSKIPKLMVHGLSIHSKNVKTGDLYIAIKGNKKNGNDFIVEAIIWLGKKKFLKDNLFS